MRSIYIYIAVLFFSFSFSQKKELRQIKRLIDEKFFQEAESVLNSNKDLLLSGDSKTDAQYYYYATKIYTEIESFVLATNSLEKLMSINTSFYNSEMKLDYKNLEEILVVALVNSAVADNSSQKWMDGVDKLLLAYEMDKETNIDYLYFAASGAVNAENFETNKKGIFAAGDICTYPGKLKLILSGFHEVALASVECFKRARPNEKYKFEFTTSSKTIQNRLGKK